MCRPSQKYSVHWIFPLDLLKEAQMVLLLIDMQSLIETSKWTTAAKSKGGLASRLWLLSRWAFWKWKWNWTGLPTSTFYDWFLPIETQISFSEMVCQVDHDYQKWRIISQREGKSLFHRIPVKKWPKNSPLAIHSSNLECWARMRA